VIDALQAMGIRADRGYPGKGMPYPDAPVVAVSLQEQTADKTILAVHVYCTVEFGGTVCEDLAMDIAGILENLDGKCTVEDCSFSGKSGLFSIRILAVWDTRPEPDIAFTVQVGAQMLPFVTAFSARRDRELTQVAAETVTDDKGWKITVTELLPLANKPEPDSAESFDLILSCRGGTEQYSDCRWSELYYEPTADGMLRRRVARCWGERAVAVG
jgi:hypothetical protein